MTIRMIGKKCNILFCIVFCRQFFAEISFVSCENYSIILFSLLSSSELQYGIDLAHGSISTGRESILQRRSDRAISL